MPLTDIDSQRLGDSVADKLGNRNLIINGAMQVAQRGTSETGVTSDGYHTVDRARLDLNSLGTYTVTQRTAAPEGFSNSFKVECTTAQSSPASGAYFVYMQRIEGQNLQMLKKGTSNAEQVTVSFYVKSDKTGNYTLGLNDRDNSRNNSKRYTISSADTWEYKTLTFEADTTGTFDNDNAESLRLDFWLASGSDFNSGTLQTGWESTVNANRAVGNVNLSDTVGNNWSITGLQLEVGNTATPFEHRTYADELARCQRYYQIITDHTDGAYGINGGYTFDNGAKTATGFNLACSLRASPTIVGATTGLGVRTQGAGDTVSAVNHTGWAANSVWLAVGVTHSDLGNNDHAAALVNVAGNSVALNSEL